MRRALPRRVRRARFQPQRARLAWRARICGGGDRDLGARRTGAAPSITAVADCMDTAGGFLPAPEGTHSVSARTGGCPAMAAQVAQLDGFGKALWRAPMSGFWPDLGHLSGIRP